MDKRLKVGVVGGGVSLISWLSDIAEVNGLYHDENLAVTSTTSSYTELDAMISSGAVPIIRRGPDADLAMAGNGAATKIIAGVVSSAVFDIVSYETVNDLAALRGARIAVIHPRYGSTLALRLAFRKAGLFDGDYELIGVGSSPDRKVALRDGVVDATILTLPYRDDPKLHVVSDVALTLDDFVASSIQANIEMVEAAGLSLNPPHD